MKKEEIKKEWEENTTYLAFIKAKDQYESLIKAGFKPEEHGAQLEELHDSYRKAHIDWVYECVNKYSAIEFGSKSNGRGLNIQ